MPQTLVSIITPCLNAEDTISQTIESVLNQSYENIEYIIIDGKSKDETISIVKEYDNDPRLRWVSKKDNSMTEALNRGLKMASGDIIATINADDWYTEGALETVVDCYLENSFNCLVGNTIFVNEQDNVKFFASPSLVKYKLAWDLMGCLTPESSVFFSSNCINQVGLFNEKLKFTLDFEYYLRILKEYKIEYIDETLSYFRVSDEQLSSKYHNEMEKEVRSYIDYPNLRMFVSNTKLETVLRILSGQRVYTYTRFKKHFAEFLKK